MANPLRKLLGIVALGVGISLSVGTASASATPVHETSHAIVHISADWWW